MPPPRTRPRRARPPREGAPAPGLRRVQQGYTQGIRRLAARSIVGLTRTRVTPNALTTAGVTLCLAAAVLVFFEYRNELLFYWLGAVVFVIGSIMDILDGALARAGGKATVFGAFLDSTLDRVGEAFMLGAIAVALARDGSETALLFTFAAMAASFLVSYTRSKAETLGLKGDVGLGSRRRGRGRSWLARGARGRDLPRPRRCPLGRPAVGDLPPRRNGVDHGRPAHLVGPPTT